jgi:hypothetical protein
MSMVVLLIVLLLLFGGGGFYLGGPAVGGGLGGLILLVLLVMLVTGRFGSRGIAAWDVENYLNGAAPRSAQPGARFASDERSAALKPPEHPRLPALAETAILCPVNIVQQDIA